MVRFLKPYELLRDTGIAEIGAIPDHWTVQRLGALGAFGKGQGGSKKDNANEGVACIRYGEIYTTYVDTITSTATRIPEELAGHYTPIRRGDVLLTASGEELSEIGKAAVLLSDQRVYCGGDINIFRAGSAIDPLFITFVLNSAPSIAQKVRLGRGTTVKHIYPAQLRQVICAIPPVAEQRAIATFITYLNTRVAQAITAKRKTIALLNEQKQAIVTQAVTRGLDSTAPLKPSGIPWVGEIPAGWETKRMKFLFRERVTKGFPMEPLLAATQSRGVIRKADYGVRTVTAMKDLHLLKLVEAGDFVISLRSFQGGIEMSHARGIISPAYTVLESINDCDRAYFQYFFKSDCFIKSLALCVTGIREGQNVSYEALRRTMLPVPPAADQAAIVQFLNDATARVEHAIVKLARECELFAELRRRLIYDVVTGKIDVREAAGRLPDRIDVSAEALAVPEELVVETELGDVG